jgi:hypothetical protein
MVDLGSHDASEADWQEFTRRCSAVELQPAELVETIESRALAAHRAGLREQSRTEFQRALALCEEKPNLVTRRLQRRFAQLFAAS